MKIKDLTLRKSRSHITSGFGSPTTSQDMMTVSPSIASVDKGFVTKRGSFEYLRIFKVNFFFFKLFDLSISRNQKTIYCSIIVIIVLIFLHNIRGTILLSSR